MTLNIACPEGTVQGEGDQDLALRVLAAFRRELYRCFSKRADALAELADAVLCKPDRVHMLAELCWDRVPPRPRRDLWRG